MWRTRTPALFLLALCALAATDTVLRRGQRPSTRYPATAYWGDEVEVLPRLEVLLEELRNESEPSAAKCSK